MGNLELGSLTFHWQPRLSINQGVCMLSPGFYHSDTDASIFLVVQTFGPTQPYMMNALFPFELICKWSEVSMQCPPATNLVIITPEMSTVLCVGWSLSSRSVHSKDFQKEHQPSLTAGEDEAQREKMSRPSLRRTRHHAHVSDSTLPRSMVGRDDSIRFRLSALINRRQDTADPELKCGTLDREGERSSRDPRAHPRPQNPRSTPIISMDILDWTCQDHPGCRWAGDGWGPWPSALENSHSAALFLFRANWLVPFLLPFHPFLFISFIFIFHLKCFFSHAFPSSEACYRSHVSLSSLYVWPFCMRLSFFPVFVCLPPLSRLPSPLFIAISPEILLLSLQGREFWSFLLD